MLVQVYVLIPKCYTMYQRAMDTDGQPFCAIESANHILSARFCYASPLDSVDSDHLLPTHLEVIPK